MSMDTFEKCKQIVQFREKILRAEQERIDGAKTINISEARNRLMNKKFYPRVAKKL